MRNPNSPIAYLDQVSLNRLADKHALDSYLQKQQIESEDLDNGFIIRPEVCASVRDLIQNLPKKESQILRLRYWEDLSIAEIADNVGMTEASVQTLLTKTLANLRMQILKTFPVQPKTRHAAIQQL
ncbi:MAG: sigma-70 family RNA polymerase sigma factor [Oligoflexales bacterium]|nr:sigma-70 family RNA polymerase sigma factor [Oligoflexales bacterium]